MLAIKLKRIGKKGQPSFRVIVAEKRSKLNGSYIEDLGWWSPITDKCEVKKDRADYWIKNGAQPTDTIHNLLVDLKVLDGPKIQVHKKKKEKKK